MLHNSNRLFQRGSFMKVALIQFNAGADKADNIRRAIDFVRRAIDRGARFILLPEIYNFRGDTRNKAEIAKIAERIPGPSVLPFAALARRHKVHILIGSVFEKSAGTSKAYNTSILINAEGKPAAKYRKIHLFDARIGDKIICESDCFLAGKSPALTAAAGFKTGLSVCYDLRFPEGYRHYCRQGAHILTVPSCFTKKTGQAHWEILLRARAVENLAYVLAPNQVGADYRGVEAYGNSMIVSPWGEVIARGSSNKEEVIYGEITMAEIEKARAILPGIAR